MPGSIWPSVRVYPAAVIPFLRALVAPGSADLVRWAANTRPDARWVAWLHCQQLAPYAFLRLWQAGALASLPPQFVEALRNRFYVGLRDAQLNSDRLVEALDALAAVASPALFKGAALAYSTYPHPACRPMVDLDVWIPAQVMQRARAALEAVDYRLVTKADRPPTFQFMDEGEVKLVRETGIPGQIELHYSFFPGEWLRRTAAIDHDGIAARVRRVKVAARTASTLSPEDAVIQLAVHMAVNHQMALPWVRGLLDIALLAREQRVDWEIVAARARAWRVATAAWLVLAIASEVFGLPGGELQVAQLRPSLLRRALLGCLARPETVLAGRDLRHTPLRLAFLVLLVDRPRDAALLLWRAVWPEREWLEARYGRSQVEHRWRHLRSALRGQP